MFGNKTCQYHPDFVVGEIYVEIKGYENAKWSYKVSQFPKDRSLQILSNKEMKPILEYVEEKYGREFWKQLYQERADVAELEDALVSKASVFGRAGSIPAIGTKRLSCR